MSMDLPEKFSAFSDARKAGLLRVKQVKEEGGRVAGIFCTFTPTEILDAAGFTSVSLCGMSDETIPAAEEHLPRNMCPLIKSSYGFAVSDKCPYTYFSDLLVGETTCDGKKKMYELLGKLKPMFVLNLPQSLAGDPVAAWAAELRRFIAYLEKTFGVTITDEALRAAARTRNEERRARLALMQLQKQTPPPMSGTELHAALDGAGFVFDPQQRIGNLKDLHRSVVEQGHSDRFAGAKRILVTGCPIGGVAAKTVKAIEEMGGVVVCFENCSGIKAAFQMVDDQAEDIVLAIAQRYMEIGCSVMAPNDKRMELFPKLVEEYRIDGIVEVDLQACTPYTVESFHIRTIAEKLNVPYLGLEPDYPPCDSAQLATRIQGFLDLM